MKPTIIVMLFLLFLFNQTADAQFRDGQEKHNRGTYGLSGKVKQVKSYYYQTQEKFGKIVEKDLSKLFPRGIRKFDEKGNALEENEYNSEGALTESFTCKYDDKGNMIELNFFDHVEGQFRVIMKYDNKGNKIEVDSYDSKGSLLGKSMMKYDGRGNRIEINAYNPDGSLLRKMNKEEIEKSFKTQKNTPGYIAGIHRENTAEFDYDIEGNQIKQREYDNGVVSGLYIWVIEYYSK